MTTIKKNSSTKPFDEQELIRNIGFILLAFSALCFITTFFIGGKTLQDSQTFEKEGGLYGPFTTTSDNEIYNIVVHQELFPNSWSYVNISLLDEEQEDLFTISESLWAETGYDQGYWSESDLKFNSDITVSNKGKYYLLFEPEFSTDPSKIGQMTVTVYKKNGSSLPFVMGGFISLLISILLITFQYGLSKIF